MTSKINIFIYLSSLAILYIAVSYTSKKTSGKRNGDEGFSFALEENESWSSILEGGNGMSTFWSLDPEAYMTVDEIIKYHGYPVIDYNVTTEDGYIITVQRIPHGIKGPQSTNKTGKPVVIFPCFLCSAATWVSNTKDKNLPYLLADSGFDVWMGNVRGTEFGRRHVKLTPEERQFWKFSFDEIGKYDIPAIIDTILNVTKYKQVLYVGHSMGTTIGFAMLATLPKYNKIVKSMFALGPATSFTYELIRSPFKHFLHFNKQLEFYENYIGTGEFLPNNRFIKLMASTTCNSPFRFFCANVLFLFGGYDYPQLNQSRLPVYIHHTPAGSSIQTVIHYGQLMIAEKFQYFDYGSEGNEMHYGQPTPPIYNVSRITTPVAIFWGENDYLTDPHDVQILADHLPSLFANYRIPCDNFTHLDFLWAVDIKTLVYDKLIELMHKSWPN